uniref:Peptidoglycan recognition protein n=1 Tax=Solen grandis TaxID=165599 RepID=G9IBU7_9BIVA|nr:peptidoglycan recognition protein [Solen grandis]
MTQTKLIQTFVVCLGIWASHVYGDTQCTNLGGTCQTDTNACSGPYVSGLCSGPASRRCCVPGDSACEVIFGTCKTDTLSCSGTYSSGRCAGPAGRRCCSSVTCASVTIVSRREWNARDATATNQLSTPVSRVFIHHTTGSTCSSKSSCSASVRGIQNYHMDSNGWNDIGYSFLVGNDGRVYEGRGWDVSGAHTQNYNSVSYGVAFIGDFSSSLPSASARTAAQNLISCGVQSGKISSSYTLSGHRDVGTTACPGTSLYNEIQTWDNYSST